MPKPTSKIQKTVQFLVREIDRLVSRPIKLMEVCGTHTNVIFRAGIRQLLPRQVELISGPGCPVCVTSIDYIDAAIECGHAADVIITTFGDMLRVPGTKSSLAREKSNGVDVRIVYSPLDCLKLARTNPAKQVVFLAVGFETTAPAVAATLVAAAKENIGNLGIMSAHKTMPAVLKALLDGGLEVDGLLLPGHVATITGVAPYQFLAGKVPAVITGFEPLDILEAIHMLAVQISTGCAKLENQYRRAVKFEGNVLARQMMETVFYASDANWRGIGIIRRSGLTLRSDYERFDMLRFVKVSEPKNNPAGCKCGQVLTGRLSPNECGFFGTSCTPSKPVGPCMVTSEGTCATWYKYSSKAGKP
jgi:hydrogenase expression/formation protein HypD